MSCVVRLGYGRLHNRHSCTDRRLCSSCTTSNRGDRIVLKGSRRSGAPLGEFNDVSTV